MSNRTLGVIAMICAPALLVEGLIPGGSDNPMVVGVASMVFMFGWLCSNTAMRRIQAAGTGIWGRAVLLVQLVGIVMALLFGFFEATGMLGRESIIFNATDLAWPLSMVWMFLPVGITVIFAKRLPGWRRFVPMLCGSWLPLGGVAMLGLGQGAAGVFGFGLTAVFWILLGYVVFTSEESAAEGRVATTEPAVH